MGIWDALETVSTVHGFRVKAADHVALAAAFMSLSSQTRTNTGTIKRALEIVHEEGMKAKEHVALAQVIIPHLEDMVQQIRNLTQEDDDTIIRALTLVHERERQVKEHVVLAPRLGGIIRQLKKQTQNCDDPVLRALQIVHQEGTIAKKCMEVVVAKDLIQRASAIIPHIEVFWHLCDST